MRQQRSLARALAVAVLACLAAPMAGAQSIPVGFQEYHIIGHEQHVWSMMSNVANAEGLPLPTPAGMNSVVSATATANNQIIYYDQWEDGFEPAIQTPVQASTIVVGDGNPANGDVCQFNPGVACGPDLLNTGVFVNFNSDQGLGCAAAPNDLRCSVPINPRPAPGPNCSSGCRFDGGDRLFTSGGPLALVHAQDPLSPFIGGATEIISREALANATSYTIPVGVDSYTGNNTVYEPFKYVDLNIVAYQDNTQVFINSPGAGTVSFTLNKGQHYSSRGLIDSGAATPLTINAGTKVSTTGPIGGLIFTGGDGTYATRFYALLPDIMHGTDYMITAPGDDPAVNGNRPLNIYMFNPDPLNPITITLTDSVGTATAVVAAGSVLDYNTATGRFVPNGSTVRLVSNRRFWGVSAYDHQSNIADWGHSWLARSFLTDTYTVSFAPGVNNPPAVYPSCGPAPCDSRSRVPVFVSAVENNTCVRIDLNNDGIFDLVDTFGDDAPNAFAGTPTCADGYLINALQSLRVYDHTDYDNTGTRIVASKPVAVAYGQDTDQAVTNDLLVQDWGYTVYPINQNWLDLVLTIEKDVSPPTVPTAGGPATYTLTVRSYDFGPVTNLSVYDCLPAGVPGLAYAAGSTLITYPNLSQGTANPSVTPAPAPGCPAGRARLTWALSPNTMGVGQTLTVRYTINIPAGPVVQLRNEAHADGMLGGSTFSALDTADVVRTDVRLTKTAADDGSPQPGDTILYTLRATNAGVAAETNVVITDPIPANTSFVPGSITNAGPFTGSYDSAQNAVVWTAASFPVGGPHNLGFSVTIDPGTAQGTRIDNNGDYESTQTPSFESNPTQTTVVGPNLIATKSGPSLLHPNEVASYTLTVRNTGAGSATNLLVSDRIPVNTTYVAGSMEWRRNAGPLTALTDASDLDQGTLAAGPARVEFRLSTLGPGEDITFRFRVRVNAGTGGGFVNNQATVSSQAVTPFDTNLVQAPIVGGADLTGHVFLDSDGNGVQGPGEPNLANVDVVVTDSAGSSQTVTTDANGNWIATVGLGCYLDSVTNLGYGGSNGFFNWSGSPWFETADDGNPATGQVQSVVDPLGVFGNSLVLTGNSGNTNKALSRQADLTGVSSATFSFNYRRFSLEAGDFASAEVSYNGGTSFTTLGTFGNGADATWQSASFVLNAAQLPTAQLVVRFRTSSGFSTNPDEFYFDNVQVCSTRATADVVDTDPDIPNGAVLTTGNDPQSATVVVGGTAATTPVGYRPAALTFTKASNTVGGLVSPGQTVTYTLQIQNNTAVTQTGVSLTDAVPPGTSYVPGSAMRSGRSLRVTEYFLASGSFTGNTFNLTLNQALAANYFAVVQGSDGSAGGAGNRGPDHNYAAITADPFGTGDLAVSAGATTLGLTRRGNNNSWVGVVSVVECLAGCTSSGFRLLDVQRVAHTGTAATGSDTSGTAWTDISRTLLMGGFNGAGCDTTLTGVDQHNSCWARLFPSGTNTINWTRDGTGNALGTATSTVMVVQWGSEWNVQRRRVQGTNGGGGVDAAGEYNTAAIGSVARARTWVWGTGHTNDNGIGDGAEGVVVTLGNGVAQNANETLLAVATEDNGTAIDFEVWALTHPDLVVNHRFVNDGGGADPDGDAGDLTVDVTVPSTIGDRMALSYNSQNNTNNNYPRPIFSTRYLNNTTIRMERRRSGEEFAAWVEGIDFTAVDALLASNAPPGLIVPADGVTIPPGGTLTVTFQVLVNDPLAAGITQITNSASLATTQQPGPFNASVTDQVVRVGVVVEPNNAGFTTPGGTVTYSHVVTNTGTLSDSFAITGIDERGWRVELLDPVTGTVIATDTNGDGVWDGGVTINTGTLAPGAGRAYDIRVTVPPGTAADTQDTARLRATSDRNPAVVADGTDETTVLDPADVGPVILIPDQSGVVVAGQSIVYPHRLFNNTGATDTFDLTADPTLAGWTSQFYADTNGDGVYTPGVDLAVSNSAQLPAGGSQLLFVKVDAPAGATPGDTDVTNLLAVSRADTRLLDSATDTTTVGTASTHDLAGGGTVLKDGGEVGVFPGTLFNLGKTADIFEIDIGPSRVNDAFTHPTELWVDTNADGVADTLVAVDSNGDGTWDTITAGWDLNNDGNPEFSVAAGSQLAYELRRALDPNQTPLRDPVTLTAISRSTGERDSITATNLLAVATLAVLSHFEVSVVEGRVVVAWSTASEVGTVGFVLERRDHPDDPYRPVHQGVLPALLNAPQGGDYELVDETAVPGNDYAYRLIEHEVWGTKRVFGPFLVTPGEAVLTGEGELLGRSLASYRGFVRKARRTSIRRGDKPSLAVAARRGYRARIDVRDEGLVRVGVPELAAILRVQESQLAKWVRKGRLRLTNQNRPVAWLADGDDALLFFGQGIDSSFTERNAYTLRSGSGLRPRSADGRPDSAAAPPVSFRETLHLEQEFWPLTAVITDPEADFWFWDFIYAGLMGYDRRQYVVSVPGVAAASGDARLTVHLQGAMDSPANPDHRIMVLVNGQAVGEQSWDGNTALALAVEFPQALLREGANSFELVSIKQPGVSLDVVYLDSFDLEYQRLFRAVGDRLLARSDGARALSVAGLSSGDGVLVLDVSDPLEPRRLSGVEVAADPAGGFRVRFASRGGARYLVTRRGAAAAPAGLVADEPGLLRDRGNAAEVVVIAPEGLEQGAAALAELRRSEGLSARVVRLQDVYDEFNAGIVDPLAIREFLRVASRRWATPPRYAVLAGDGSFDYKDRMRLGGNLIPPALVATPQGLVSSDNRLADLVGDDGVPEVAIGRLPVRSAAELDAWVAKAAAYSAASGSWRYQALWVADNPDAGGEFSMDADALLAGLPQGFESSKLYVETLGAPGTRSGLLERLADGAGLVNYLGHGGLDRLADEGLLVTADAARLGNGDRLPVITALTCVAGRFELPGFDSLAEALLLREDGGAIAFLAPSGFSMNAEAQAVGAGFLAALGRGAPRLGDAVRSGLLAHTRLAKRQAHVPFLYVLLGDPSTRPAWPR